MYRLIFLDLKELTNSIKNPTIPGKMKIVARSFFTAFLLKASVSAIGAPQQPSVSGPVKEVTDNSNPNKDSDSPAPFNITAAMRPDIDTSMFRIETRSKAAVERVKDKANELKAYAAAHNYNTEYAFLVDMSLPSGKNRFFIYDFKKDVIESSSLVAHGFGSAVPNSYDELIFSNTPDSYMTSLGKYKIGASYYGSFGLSYKLHGLESTNDKAFQRTVVLHSAISIPDVEPFPNLISQSAGCPMVSKSFLDVLTRYIKASKKPVLLWIYYS